MAEDERWYEGGLRFTCTHCGNCCGGGPGTVRVSEREIAALASCLDLPVDRFRRRYSRRLSDGDVSLRTRRNHDCVFYDRTDGRCAVYAERPKQCRTWPFWRSIVHSRRRWQRAARRCPGMGTGRLHPARVVAEISADDGTSGKL